MTIPGYNYSERHEGGQQVPGNGQQGLFIGVCTGGTITANTVTPIPKSTNIATKLGQGPLAECMAYVNSLTGANGSTAHGPHYALQVTAGVAATRTAVTQSGSGPAVTLGGDANDTYDGIAEIVTGGANGTAKFKYTLDGGKTYSPDLTVPSGGSYLMANTGITLTFASGTHVAGTTHSFQTTAPHFNTTNLATAITAMLAATTKHWDFIVLVGDHASAAAAASMFSAASTQLATLVTNHRYNGLIMDAGSVDSTANHNTEFASLTDDRIGRIYGRARIPSQKSFQGWSNPVVSGTIIAGGRAATSLISESLGRTATGPLRGVTDPTYDEFVSGELDGTDTMTFRTFPGNSPPGVHITEDHVAKPATSSVILWPYRRILDRAATIRSRIMLTKILENFPTKPNKTLTDRAASDLESEVNAALKDELFQPDAKGTGNHVSDVYCTIDTSNPYGTTREIKTRTLIRPAPPAKTISDSAGFTSGSVTGETPEEPEEEAEDTE